MTGNTVEYVGFVARKWFRLFPTYYLVLFISWLRLHPHLAWKPADGDVWEPASATLTFLGMQSQFPVVFRGIYIPMALEGHLWFISTLWFCLLVYPALHWLFQKYIRGRLSFTVATMLFCASLYYAAGKIFQDDWHAFNPYFHWGPGHFCTTFALGVGAAEFISTLPTTTLNHTLWKGVDCLCCGFIAFAPGSASIPAAGGADLAVVAVTAVFLISTAAETRGLLAPLLCHPSLQSLGKYTFEAYMLQFVIMNIGGSRGYWWHLHTPGYLLFVFMVSGVCSTYFSGPCYTAGCQWLDTWKARMRDDYSREPTETTMLVGTA